MNDKGCDTEGQIEYSDSLNSFVENIKRGPSWTRIKISAIPQFYEGIATYVREYYMKGQGKSSSEMTTFMWENIRAICPICFTWIRGQILGAVWSISQFERDKVLMTNYGPRSCLLDGRCVNLNCASKEILLIWEGCKDYKMLIEKCLNQARTYAEKRGYSEIKRCVESLNHPDSFSFVNDMVFNFKLKIEENKEIAFKELAEHIVREADSKEHEEERANILLKAYNIHYYAGIKLFSNIWVWVSVIPNYGEGTRDIFFFKGGEYLNFLKELTVKADYNSGKVTVVHWVCLPFRPFSFFKYKNENEEQPIAYFTIIPEKNLNRGGKIFTQAKELLREEERKSDEVEILTDVEDHKNTNKSSK